MQKPSTYPFMWKYSTVTYLHESFWEETQQADNSSCWEENEIGDRMGNFEGGVLILTENIFLLP